MRIKLIRSLIFAWFALAIAGCGPRGPQVVDKQIIPVADSTTARPLQFQRIVIDIKRGTDIGMLSKGIGFCTESHRWLYRPGDLSFSGKELTEAFRSELTAANYNVVGDPDALFDDPSAWKAEYLVAGAIKSMNADLCYFYDRFVADTKVYGYAVMEVNWQVYSRLDRKVVYQITTQGRGDTKEPTVTGDPDVFLDGFAQATRNLLADPGFHDLITGATPTRTAGPAIALQEAVAPNGAPFEGTIRQNMQAVRANVVTVRSVEGHGSGFFIDSAGHVLTNEHVVGGSGRVKVILESGQQLDGTVIAADARRDVAVVKVAPAGLSGLPLRVARPEIGAEVYAVGSPLLEELSGTVSKGIVSAYRSFDGLDYIQSDVTTVEGSSGGPLLDDHGNVLGITVAAFTEADVPAGINLFIPIGDALRALGIGPVASAN
jgi:serine protease Do